MSKFLVGVWGGQWYGLSKRVAFRSGLSLIARGEFSVVIAALAVGSFKVLAGMYILVIAIIGIGLFLFAPRLTAILYGDKEKKRKQKISVPS